MHAGETVGILMDTNMTPPQGVFVEFFGRQACTASGLARVALKTGAAVLPGFMVWEAAERKYVLHFGPELEFPAPATRRPMLWPHTACAPLQRKSGFGAILTSGYGFTGAGRRGRRGSRGWRAG
jgi:hypothetical protein